MWHDADAELSNTGSSSLQRATFVGMPATIPFADAVRITDTTDPSAFNSRPTADGYDLDAVKVSQLASNSDETGRGDGPRFVDSTWPMYFDYISRCVTD